MGEGFYAWFETASHLTQAILEFTRQPRLASNAPLLQPSLSFLNAGIRSIK